MPKLIPRSITNPEERRRAQVIVMFGGGFGVFNLGFVAVFAYLGWWAAAIHVLVSSLVMVASPIVLIRTRSLQLSAVVLIAGLLVLFAGISFLLGGLSGASTPVLTAVPIVAFFLLGRRAGWLAMGLVATIILIFLVANLWGLQPPAVEVPDRLVYIMLSIGLLSATSINLVFVVQYDDARDDAVLALQASQKRMASMIEHLNVTSSTLTRSAKQFSGKRRGRRKREVERPIKPEDLGLTQQMLDTASTSRDMITAVQSTIRAIINQYAQISTQISGLGNVSSAISDMVTALSKISSRLEFMALNTSLEAARTGEAGKGFLLLAEDMRRLAEQVLDETATVKNAILDIRQRTQQAIEAAARGQSLTNEGVAQLENMSSVFENMFELIERAAAASRTVTEDTIKQIATVHALVSAALMERAGRGMEN